MYPALAVILASLGAFSIVAVRPSGRSSGAEQLRGFVYVGAAALLLLAVAVLLVGRFAEGAARAEGLAMFGLFSYAVYLLVALLVLRLTGRR